MKKFILLSALSCFALSSNLYLNKDIAIMKDNKQIATANILSPISIVKDNNSSLLIKIDGYVNDSYQEEIVQDISKNASYVNFWDKDENASYSSSVNPYIQFGEKKEDDYGEIWHKASFTFEVKKDDITNNPNELLTKAKSLYEQSCSPCHQLHDTKEYTISQWPPNLESMISSGYIDLEKDEKNLLIKYLQFNAKDAQ